MDSRAIWHYSLIMVNKIVIAFKALLISVLLAPVATSADDGYIQYDDPTLLNLGYRKDKEIKTIRVGTKRGLYLAPIKARMYHKWKILPGEALESKRRPRYRVVSLFKGTKRNNRVLICQVIVWYFRDPKNRNRWIPHFRLNQEHLAAKVGGKWNPITSIRGVPTLVVITSTTLPNPHGYYPSLEFGLTNQQTKIDSWYVH